MKGWILALSGFLLQSEWGPGPRVYCWVHCSIQRERREKKKTQAVELGSSPESQPGPCYMRLPRTTQDGRRELKDSGGGRGDLRESGVPGEQEERVGGGFGATVGRFANANTFPVRHITLCQLLRMCVF